MKNIVISVILSYFLQRKTRFVFALHGWRVG